MRRIYLVLLITAAAFPVFAGEGDSAFTLKPKVARYDYDAIPKDPLASAFFSATLPGSGQIYNKEYLRGVITGAGFYASFYLMQYMLARFDDYNMDTVYFAETSKDGRYTGYYRAVYVPRAEADQKWPSAGEKYAFMGSIAACAGFYVLGVIDSYRGAKRYNSRLVAAADRKLSFRLACSLPREKIGGTVSYRF